MYGLVTNDAVAKIYYTGTTFNVPFYKDGTLLSYGEIMGVINANLPDNRPIIIYIYVQADGLPYMHSELQKMTSRNYNLAFIYLGLHIEESHVRQKAMTSYFSAPESIEFRSKRSGNYKCQICGNIHQY